MTSGRNPFDDAVTRYDGWFDSPKGRVLFENELAAIRLLWRSDLRPALEVGVGTGRFAEALGVAVKCVDMRRNTDGEGSFLDQY